MDKVELRRIYLKRRQEIPPAIRADKDSEIHRQLIAAVDWSRVARVHIYGSLPTWGEVDTQHLIGRIRQLNPSAQIDIAELGTDQPAYDAAAYDLIIVPVLAYDNDNYRLGMGKGWYDRFLKRHPKAYKVGLAYTESHIDSLPVEVHDVPLDKIISS